LIPTETDKWVAAPGGVTVTVRDPVTETNVASVAVTDSLPAVLRVSPGLRVLGNLWTPASAAVKV
jgi:hypothetical protein